VPDAAGNPVRAGSDSPIITIGIDFSDETRTGTLQKQGASESRIHLPDNICTPYGSGIPTTPALRVVVRKALIFKEFP
jgi:hypothetical protein